MQNWRYYLKGYNEKYDRDGTTENKTNTKSYRNETTELSRVLRRMNKERLPKDIYDATTQGEKESWTSKIEITRTNVTSGKIKFMKYHWVGM